MNPVQKIILINDNKSIDISNILCINKMTKEIRMKDNRVIVIGNKNKIEEIINNWISYNETI
jgi:hypothetical protein